MLCAPVAPTEAVRNAECQAPTFCSRWNHVLQLRCPPRASGGDFFFFNYFLAYYLEQGSLQMMLTEGPQDEIVYTLVSSEEERTHEQTESRIPCEIGGRDRSDTSTTQRALRTASSHQQPGERPGTDSPAASVSVEGTNPADVSIQNCEGRDFCCFKSPRMWRFVKIAGKPIRLLNQNPHFARIPR